MLRFTFDNNVWEDLIDSEQYAEAKKQILESLDRGINTIYFSYADFGEFLKGTSNQKQLSKFQKYMREAFILTGQGNVLGRPQDHIGMSWARPTPSLVAAVGKEFCDNLCKFCNARDYREFLHEFKDYLISLREDEVRMSKELAHESPEAIEHLNRYRDAEIKLCLSYPGHLDFWKLMGLPIFRNLGLERVWIKETPEFLAKRFKSVKMVSDLIQVLYYKAYFQYRKPSPNDNWDLRRVYYLDVCDYLVSNDRRLIALADNWNESPHCGKIIRLSKFLKHIDRQFLPARALINDSEAITVSTRFRGR